MTRSYKDYIGTGQMKPKEAAQRQATRESARAETSRMLRAGGIVTDAAAFGMMDVLAVKMVEWYGPEAAAEVFAHYRDVVARQPGKGTE